MLLKKISALIFLLIFALSSFNPAFAGPTEEEPQQQGISKRKLSDPASPHDENKEQKRSLSDPEDNQEDTSHAQNIENMPAPNFWEPIPLDTLLQAPCPYVCLYLLYNVCCGCFRAGQ